MLSRSELSSAYTLSAPASASAIEQEEAEYGGPLPQEYVDLLRVSDGLHTDGNFSILGVEGVVRRNEDYQVGTHLPDYFMIGDDGGGIAILLNLRDRRIYEVDMGVMDEDGMRLSAESLTDLLCIGTSLVELAAGKSAQPLSGAQRGAGRARTGDRWDYENDRPRFAA